MPHSIFSSEFQICGTFSWSNVYIYFFFWPKLVVGSSFLLAQHRALQKFSEVVVNQN